MSNKNIKIMSNKNIKIESIVKNSYEKLKKIHPKLKKFSFKLKIKGDHSNLDSVDIVSFFSILDQEIEKNKLKNPNFMNENFFFKLNNITIENIIEKIKNKNGYK